MGDLTDNYSRREFICRRPAEPTNPKSRKMIPCECGRDGVDYVLVKTLERIRSLANGHLNANGEIPLIIISANRCDTENARVGGVKNSQHLYGKAADIRVPGLSPVTLYKLIDGMYPVSKGLGLYPRHVHIDVRAGRFRWHRKAY